MTSFTLINGIPKNSESIFISKRLQVDVYVLSDFLDDLTFLTPEHAQIAKKLMQHVTSCHPIKFKHL